MARTWRVADPQFREAPLGFLPAYQTRWSRFLLVALGT